MAAKPKNRRKEEDTQRQDADQGAGGTEEEPKSAIASFLSAFGRTAAQLTAEPSRVFALFLIAAMFAMFMAVMAKDPAGSTSLVILAALGACLVLTLIVLWRGERYRVRVRLEPATRVRTKVAYFLALALVLLAAVVTLDKLGIVARAFPGLYPERAAVDALKAHFAALDGFLRSSPGERVESFVTYASTLAPRLREGNLPAGSVSALAARKAGDTSADGALQACADEYRKRYGKIDGVLLESVGIESWRPVEKKDNRRVAYVLAIARYTGKFAPNDLRERRLTVAHLHEALNDPHSDTARALMKWVVGFFPDADRQKVMDFLGRVQISALAAENVIDLLSYYDQGRTLGTPDDADYRFGSELALYSVKMEVASGGCWQVSEVGKWGVYRIFTAPVPQAESAPVADRVAVDGVPYVRQEDDTLCQSAALHMLYRYVRKAEYPGGQRKIREDLAALPGGATSHDARLAWLKTHLPGEPWQTMYVGSPAEVVRQLRRQLKGNRPAVMSTRLTKDGHVVVVTGLWRNGAGHVIVRVHDPWGRFDFEALRYDTTSGVGRDVEYPLERLAIRNREWIGADDKRVLSRFVVGLDEWIPSVAECLGGALRVVEVREDWEWMGVSGN